MIRIIFLIFLVFSSLSFAIDKPGIMQLFSEGSDMSYIGVNCSEVKDKDSILCEFSKSSLSYKLNPDELVNEINEIKEELDRELKSVSVTDLKKTLCPNAQADFEAKNNEINAMKSGFKKEYSKKYYTILSTACKVKTKDELISLNKDLLILKAEKEAATCNVVTHHWNNEFNPIVVTSSNQHWQARIIGDGDCRMVKFSSLKKGDEHLWKYKSSWIITNETGNEFIPCDQFKPKDDNYSSQKKEYDNRCKVFTFGF
jgi:hypothetical protein